MILFRLFFDTWRYVSGSLSSLSGDANMLLRELFLGLEFGARPTFFFLFFRKFKLFLINGYRQEEKKNNDLQAILSKTIQLGMIDENVNH